MSKSAGNIFISAAVMTFSLLPHNMESQMAMITFSHKSHLVIQKKTLNIFMSFFIYLIVYTRVIDKHSLLCFQIIF